MYDDDNQVLVIPSIANIVIPEFQRDRQAMAAIQDDIRQCSGLVRDVFLADFIQKHDGSISNQSIRVVDGSSAVITSGEFSSLLALGVNLSTGSETPLDLHYHHVFAPNSESFGMVASPVMAACEVLALAKKADSGYTLYDGSLQGLNMNLGNLFRTQSDSGFLGEISEYTDKLSDLFSCVADPLRDRRAAFHVGETVYSSVFNQQRDDLFAISKRNTSTYTFHRIQDHPELKKALRAEWFSRPKSDRLLLGQILKGGEYIGPVPFVKVESKSGGAGLFGLADVAKKGDRACNAEEYQCFLHNLYFVFFKPNDHSPVMRIELVASRDKVAEKTAEILQILSHQCSNPGLVEPYGLWLADKIAKQVQSFKSIYGNGGAMQFPELFRPNRTEEIR